MVAGIYKRHTTTDHAGYGVASRSVMHCLAEPSELVHNSTAVIPLCIFRASTLQHAFTLAVEYLITRNKLLLL